MSSSCGLLGRPARKETMLVIRQELIFLVQWMIHHIHTTNLPTDSTPGFSSSVKKYYRQTYNISDILESNRIVYHAAVLFIIKLTHDWNRLHKDNYKTRRETFKFWDLVRLILEILRYAFRMAGSTPFQIVTHPVSGWILSLCRGYIKHM